MGEKETFVGECQVAEKSRATRVCAVLHRTDDLVTDIDFVLRHRYIGKRVRVTVEVLDPAPSTEGER